MVNKAKRMLHYMSELERKIIIEKIGDVDENATPLKQARYIHSCLETCNNENIDRTNFMRKCGKGCISANTIKTAKKLLGQSKNIEEFLEKLNEAGIGGGNLYIEKGKIIGIYKTCYCNIPKKISNMNKSYCECSAGWFETLFSEILKKNVKVTVISTINDGAKECVFEIENII